MAPYLPTSLVSATATPDVVIEAAYFVIRTLRNHLRGYQSLAVSPESPEPAYQLAHQALVEIQEAEGQDLHDIPPERARAYIEAVEQLSRQTFDAASGPGDAAKADDLLAQLRNEHPFDTGVTHT
jgi:hypothetical protein